MDTSYLTQQVTTIVGQLHNLFDEIGVPSHERDSRESELFASLSETLHGHLRSVASEKNELIEEGNRIITTVKQMEASLDDVKSNGMYASTNRELKITYPLHECLQNLQEKHKAMSKLHQERYEQVKKLLQALESYSSHLEPSFLKIKLPPVASDGTVPPTFDLSPSYIDSIDTEFTRVYEEYAKRVSLVQQLSEEIVTLWAELGTPQAQTDSSIVRHWRDAPEQLGLHQDDVNGLRSRREKLFDEKKAREKRLKDLKSQIETLWNRLSVNEAERKKFLAGTRGCGLRTINDLEDELSRLNELKRQNLGLFVEDARTRLNILWDELYMSEEEAVEFTPMFCDVFSDALLSAHEAEISRLEALKEQRAPTLHLIDRHRSLVKERDELAASSQDSSRLMLKPAKGEKRDPGKLLREEKMRKRIAKELPKIEKELEKILAQWEDEYGRPFLVFGERYLDVLEECASRAAPGPRSKTPNALAPRSHTPSSMAPPPRPGPKSAPQTQTQRMPPSREGSALRAKTPVPTLSRNPAPTAKSSASSKSPSRIPARVPLGAHSGNSPERRTQPEATKSAASMQKMGPPLMAPLPKVRNVQQPSAQVSTPTGGQPGDVFHSGSIVRSMPPEDPYGNHRSFFQAPNQAHPLAPAPQHVNGQRDMRPPTRAGYNNGNHYAYSDTASSISSDGTRQTSATSQTTATSASENWETYEDDCGEPERDGRDDYYAKLRAATGKRQAPEGQDYGRTLKAFNGANGIDTMVYGENGQRAVGGSDAGWTDEDVY